ncbi:hypothetical protein ExPCM16_00869 [Escherichia coli]|nr:hypothetical protein ExPCM16_00869 [Escherichia coli]
MRRVATCVSPTCSGYFTFWFNIAVTAGRTDKFWPRTNAHQRCILAMQQSTRLFHIKHQLRLCRDLHAEIRFRFHFRWRSALNGQTRVGPGLPASVQQAHIFHAGIKHNLRHTRCSVYVTPVQNDRGVMANAVFCQHRFQLFIRNFVPQRFAFHFVGVDVVSAGNMADKVKFWSAPGRFNDFPVTGRFRRNLFTLLQVMQPLRIYQLFKVRQFLQTGRFA